MIGSLSHEHSRGPGYSHHIQGVNTLSRLLCRLCFSSPKTQTTFLCSALFTAVARTHLTIYARLADLTSAHRTAHPQLIRESKLADATLILQEDSQSFLDVGFSPLLAALATHCLCLGSVATVNRVLSKGLCTALRGPSCCSYHITSHHTALRHVTPCHTTACPRQ